MGVVCLSQLLLVVFVVSCGAENSYKRLPPQVNDPRVGSDKGAVHVVTTTECNGGYFEFQSLALKFSFDKVRQPGSLTRIVSCDRKASIQEEDMEIMDTLVVPSWTVHPRTGDWYSPYNRPVGLMFWLEERRPSAEWTLIVDPDMQFRQPFLVEGLEIPEGYALSSGYSYLKGVKNELAERHLAQIPRRDDTFGGPRGRRADQAGAYYLIRTRDLMKVVPLWLEYTEKIRDDPKAWNLTGDQYAKPGGRVWISEMYGYVFGAAAAGIWHRIDSTTQSYPDYSPRDIPILTHYGLLMKLGDYVYDKHFHFSFDSFACPPWNLDPGRGEKEDRGLFPHPPFPDSIEAAAPRERYGKLMILEAVNVINQALCRRHMSKCSPSDQLTKECATVDRLARALESEFEKLHAPNVLCYDEGERCPFWAENGECERGWAYMDSKCRAACHRCRHYIPTHALHANQTVTQKTSIPIRMDVVFEADVELVRCSTLNRSQFLADAACNQLILAGYAKLTDFFSDQEPAREQKLHWLTSKISFLILFSFLLSLTLFCLTLVKYRRTLKQRAVKSL